MYLLNVYLPTTGEDSFSLACVTEYHSQEILHQGTGLAFQALAIALDIAGTGRSISKVHTPRF